MAIVNATGLDYVREVVAPDCPNCGANPCYTLCHNSPHYYSPEQEREDERWNDSLSDSEWFQLAVIQYRQVYGEDYVS